MQTYRVIHVDGEGSSAELSFCEWRANMGRLTTHVLDTAAGKPAAHLLVRLFLIEEDQSRTLKTETKTNQDGRTAQPLLDKDAFRCGTYELSFQVDQYFTSSQHTLSSPPFFDVITVRFTIADDSQHFHVPLLVSPWSYSTYRGS